jgi:hypothetical protein
MKLAREYVMAIISFIATLALTLVAELLKFSHETTYIVFALGATITLTATLLEKELETKLKDDVSRTLDLYRQTKEIEDGELQSEVFKLAKSLSQGEVPPYIAAIRSTKLFDRAKKSVYAADYSPQPKDILHWENSRLATWYKSGVNAVARGVSLERVFIIKKCEALDNGKWDKDYLRILQRQFKDGIKVRILWMEEVTSGDVKPQRDVLRNLVIFDEVEVLITTQEPRIFRLPSEKVREYIEVFEEQKKYSRSFEEIISEYPIE